MIKRNKYLASSSILDKAMEMTNWSNFNPMKFKQKIISVTIILVIGVIGSLATLIVIYLRLPKTEAAQLLTIFLLLSSIAIVAASLLGITILFWRAYLSQYIQRLDAEYDAEILSLEVVTLAKAILDIVKKQYDPHTIYEDLLKDSEFKHIFDSA